MQTAVERLGEQEEVEVEFRYYGVPECHVEILSDYDSDFVTKLIAVLENNECWIDQSCMDEHGELRNDFLKVVLVGKGFGYTPLKPGPTRDLK